MNKASRIVSLVLLALAGCGGPVPDGAEGSVSQDIIGGNTDASDPAVVLLFGAQPGMSNGYLCSGTLIAPTVVLTAAHCVSPQTVGTGIVFQVFTGTDWNMATANSWADVKEVHFDSAFNVQNLGNGHDVAVAILTTASKVTPVKRNRATLDSSYVGKPVRIVGFGVNNGKALSGVGVKRTVTTSIDDLSSLFLHIGDSNHQTCEGDSGGPAFMVVGGATVLVGVTSFGESGCVGGAWDTRIDTYNSFVDKYAAPSVNTTPVPTAEPSAAAPRK